MQRTLDRTIKDIIKWIRNQGMGSMNGKRDGNIEEISKTISEMVMGNYIIKIKILFTRVIGKMVKKFKENLKE